LRHPVSGIGSCRSRGRRHGSDERTESTRERNGRNELTVKGGTFVWGLRPQTPGIYRIDAHPSEISLPLGLSSKPAPSLVLAPESALSLLPSRGFSSAPAARSVSTEIDLRNHASKNILIIAALSDMVVISASPVNQRPARAKFLTCWSHFGCLAVSGVHGFIAEATV
jgi:hypothetical protein